MTVIAALQLIAQPRTPVDLAADRRQIRLLLKLFAGEPDTSRRANLLRLAIDLFDTQMRIGEAARLLPVSCTATALFDLIESVEMTHPASRLYALRGHELARLMAGELARQDRQPVLFGADLSSLDTELLHSRRILLARAQALAPVDGGGSPAPTGAGTTIGLAA